jgi:decaprenyl-phosphate phosphoribosyltransferase
VAQSTAASFIRLARPHQWAKSIFVIIGPAYGIATGKQATWSMIVGLLGAVIAFCLAASACYVLNDIRDREADKVHPRKRLRPIAFRRYLRSLAIAFAAVLAIGH